MTAQDLRSFVAAYREAHPSEVVSVGEAVSADYDVMAVVLEYERRRRWPILFFERVVGHDMPIVANVVASRRALAFALGVDERALAAEYARRLKEAIKPVVVSDVAFRERLVTGDQVDLGALPVPLYFPGDAGRYLTAGMLVARDPETGVETEGYHRFQVKSRNRMGVSLHSRRRMFEYHRRAEEAGRPLEVAVVLGVPPAVSLGSIAFPPADAGKFGVIGGLLGEPLEVARCRTVDLDVPRWAEIVVEGHVLHDEREKEGPFGEFTGYASTRGTENILVPTAIQHSRGAIYQSHNAGLSLEHCMFLALPREVMVSQVLRRTIPNLTAVRVPIRSECGSLHVYVSLRKTAEA